MTISRIEPGSIVLRMTTVCRSVLVASAAPISLQTARTYLRSRLPLVLLGVPTAHEREIRIAHSDLRIGRCSEHAAARASRDYVSDLGLDDWRLAGVDQVDFRGVRIHADDAVTVFRQAADGDSVDVAETKYANSHCEGPFSARV
jgi:hypothetical protein